MDATGSAFARVKKFTWWENPEPCRRVMVGRGEPSVCHFTPKSINSWSLKGLNSFHSFMSLKKSQYSNNSRSECSLRILIITRRLIREIKKKNIFFLFFKQCNQIMYFLIQEWFCLKPFIKSWDVMEITSLGRYSAHEGSHRDSVCSILWQDYCQP